MCVIRNGKKLLWILGNSNQLDDLVPSFCAMAAVGGFGAIEVVPLTYENKTYYVPPYLKEEFENTDLDYEKDYLMHEEGYNECGAAWPTAISTKANVFKDFVTQLLNNDEIPVNGSAVMGDRAGRTAHKYLFPHVPARPFIVTLRDKRRVQVTAHKSKEYINGRHNSRVQHVTLVCELLKKEKKNGKA